MMKQTPAATRCTSHKQPPQNHPNRAYAIHTRLSQSRRPQSLRFIIHRPNDNARHTKT